MNAKSTARAQTNPIRLAVVGLVILIIAAVVVILLLPHSSVPRTTSTTSAGLGSTITVSQASTVTSTISSSGKPTGGPGMYFMSQSEAASLVGSANFTVLNTTNSSFIDSFLASHFGIALSPGNVTGLWWLSYSQNGNVNHAGDTSTITTTISKTATWSLNDYAFVTTNSSELYGLLFNQLRWRNSANKPNSITGNENVTNATLNGMRYSYATNSTLTYLLGVKNGSVAYVVSSKQLNETPLATIVATDLP